MCNGVDYDERCPILGIALLIDAQQILESLCYGGYGYDVIFGVDFSAAVF